MARATMARPRNPATVKRTKFRGKVKMKEFDIMARKAQGPKWRMRITAPQLDVKVEQGGPVASSWIGEIYWVASRKWAHMILMNGYRYNVYIPFGVFEQWYYSPSKGTFFNYAIKDKYTVVRSA